MQVPIMPAGHKPCITNRSIKWAYADDPMSQLPVLCAMARPLAKRPYVVQGSRRRWPATTDERKHDLCRSWKVQSCNNCIVIQAHANNKWCKLVPDIVHVWEPESEVTELDAVYGLEEDRVS